MFYESRHFSLPKDLLRADENQDAFGLDMARGIAVVADGVSTGLFAGAWAKILVNAAAAQPLIANNTTAITAWLQDLRHEWSDSIDVSSLAWYQKPKLKTGAASTLLWLQVTEDSSGNLRLRSYALGDSCLFHLRGTRMLHAFPLSESRLFNDIPLALVSIEQSAGACPEFETWETSCERGDLLVLCTDALAAWALAQAEAGHPVDWESWWDLPHDEWRQTILHLRNLRHIRYDDTTLLLLRL